MQGLSAHASAGRSMRRTFVGRTAAAAVAAVGAVGARRAIPLSSMALASPARQAAETVKIVSALPLTGPSYGQTIAIVHGIRLAVEEAGRQAGPFFVEYEAWDDATAAAGDWDPEKVAELARHAAHDPEVLVYIGHFASEATRIALPILNAQGLVTINPSNTAPGLTKRIGAEPGEPETYYPAGMRSFARVIPSVETQGAAGAGWAKVLSATTAYVVDDGEPYGRIIADSFITACARAAIRVAGRTTLAPGAADFRTTAETVRAASPDVVYFGGVTANRPGQLLKDLRSAGFVKHVIGPNGIRNALFLAQAEGSAEGVWATSVGVPPAAYWGGLSEWRARYEALSGAEPETYALYGYEAARVALDALARAGVKDRNVVRDAVFATREFDGLLGRWSIDANGDTSDTTMTVNRASRVADGLEWVPYDVVSAP